MCNINAREAVAVGLSAARQRRVENRYLSYSVNKVHGGCDIVRRPK